MDFSSLSLYGLIDADSDEAHTFTTYMGYWTCLADHLQNLYGDNCGDRLLHDLRAEPRFRKLSGQGKPTNLDDLRKLLLNGWTSELRLNLIELDDAKRLGTSYGSRISPADQGDLRVAAEPRAFVEPAGAGLMPAGPPVPVRA